MSSSRQRRILWAAFLGMAATLGAGVAYHRPLVSRWVTARAFRDADELAGRIAALPPGSRESENAVEEGVKALAERYGDYFRHGYFHFDDFVGRCPSGGFVREAIAPVLVGGAYFTANERRLQLRYRDDELDVFLDEMRRWQDPVLLRSAPRELLVNVLIGDPEQLLEVREMGLLKRLVCEALLLRDIDKYGPGEKPGGPDLTSVARVVGALEDRHWQAILRDCDHSREKVRAGALLLLFHHPQRDVFLGRARGALQDPSPWARLAAAGVLALRGDESGAPELLLGLDHERWEVRWWCGMALAAMPGTSHTPALRARQALEQDEWLKGELEDMWEAREEWEAAAKGTPPPR